MNQESVKAERRY